VAKDRSHDVGGIALRAVHLPDMTLAGATLVLGAAFALIYLRWRNTWPLALYHGWLGVFFYLLGARARSLGRDVRVRRVTQVGGKTSLSRWNLARLAPLHSL
jgi:hypothetical protein